MADRYDPLIRDIREYSQQAKSVAEVILELRLRVEEMQPPSVGYTLVSVLHRAFELDLGEAKMAAGWVGLGWGGPMSDDELERMIGRLVPRSRDLLLACSRDGYSRVRPLPADGIAGWLNGVVRAWLQLCSGCRCAARRPSASSSRTREYRGDDRTPPRGAREPTADRRPTALKPATLLAVCWCGTRRTGRAPRSAVGHRVACVRRRGPQTQSPGSGRSRGAC